MSKRLCQAGAPVLAIFAVLSLAADLMLKDAGDLDQVFWSCYWASIAIVIGVFLRRDWLVSSGLTFFIGVGLPAWALGRLMDATLDPTSVLIHTVPVLAAVAYLIHRGPLPKYSALGAWTLHFGSILLARFLTTSGKNISLAHSVWPPVSGLFPHLWEFHIAILTVSAITLTLAAYGMNYLLIPRHVLLAEADQVHLR